MDEAARFAFYEKIYFYELERKEKLISRLNLPLAILGVLLSFLSYMLSKAPGSEDGFAGVWFWILYLSAVFCLLCGAYYFRSSWQLRDFDRGLPTLTELETYRAETTTHFAVHGENEDDAETYFKTIILSYYIEGATVNTVNNDKRGSKLVSLANSVTLTMIFSVLSFIPFYTHQQELNQHEQSKASATSATSNALR
ncbi:MULTISPECIES: hypothetical protein [Pseudomonas]|uniref:Uncharacterized protein n=1 Tax=Pseudomonas fluorescens TaxID=294 RepID=A0A5E7H253_PSEFL|nr:MULTISPECIES: hypothetical protein [Pseudomonas]VVO57332.1 hypothetical protein PS847_00604 [Pseudomonas fluorescens]